LPPPNEVPVPHSTGTAYVLQIEIARPADTRQARLADLGRLSRLIESTATFKAEKRERAVVPLNQENGYTVVFFGEQNSPVQCAVELSKALSESPEKMTVRIGISAGLVTHTIGGISSDVDGVSGKGVDEARQVANLSDPRQILLSGFRDFLKDSEEWRPWVRDLGEVNLKRDVSTKLCNFAGEGFGNPARPRNWAFLKAKYWTGKEVIWAGPACAFVLLAILTLGKPWISNRPEQGPLGEPRPTPVRVHAPESPRDLSPHDCPTAPDKGPVDIDQSGFIASGWMGDPEKDPDVLEVEFSATRPGSPWRHAEQWTYKPKPGGRYAAVAWLCGENNFGQKPGKDWSRLRLSNVSIWARGVKDHQGYLPKVQFEVGGHTNPSDTTKYPYQASFQADGGGWITLSEDWKEYQIDLKGKNLSQVIAAFVFTVKAKDVGPDGATFFLDNITYQ